jgi:2-polyprenyl-3-methyl-5-hydroxy-6-metoxy-1,4-benzoquinol methylase
MTTVTESSNLDAESNLTDKEVWENYYKGKNTFNTVNKFINRNFFDAEIIGIKNQYLKSNTPKKLIEMGAGGSEWLPYFAKKHRHTVYGIDYLQIGCDIAEEKLIKEGIKEFEIYCGDFYEFYRQLSEKMDFVVSFGVVEHFDPPSKVLKAFGNYIKDDGIMITTCPNTS